MAFAESLEIEAGDLQQFFTILSANGSRRVDLETFVIGCIKLRGMAKSMDLMDLLLSHRQLSNEQKKLIKVCERNFDNLTRLLNGVPLEYSFNTKEAAPLGFGAPQRTITLE